MKGTDPGTVAAAYKLAIPIMARRPFLSSLSRRLDLDSAESLLENPRGS